MEVAPAPAVPAIDPPATAALSDLANANRAARRRVLLLALGDGARLSAWLATLQRFGLEPLLASCLGSRLVPAPETGLALPVDPSPWQLSALADTARPWPVAAVLPGDRTSQEPAAALARRLKLPCPCPPPRQNPAQFRRQLLDAGLLIPRFRHLDPDRPLAGQLGGLRYPCILRGPRGGRQADSAWALLRLCRRWGKRQRRGLLAEDYIWGVECRLLGLLIRGRLHPLALCDRVEPEVGWVTPSRLPPPLQGTLLADAERACAALELEAGLVRVRVRVNRAGVWFLGIDADTGSGPWNKLREALTGGVFETLILAGLLGLPPSNPQIGSVGVAPIFAPRRARLRRLEGLRAATCLPLVREVSLHPNSEAGLLCLIRVRAPSPEQAETALRIARARLRVIVAPR